VYGRQQHHVPPHEELVESSAGQRDPMKAVQTLRERAREESKDFLPDLG